MFGFTSRLFLIITLMSTVLNILLCFRPQETEADADAAEVTGETSAFEQAAVSQTEATPPSCQEAEDEEDGAAQVAYWSLLSPEPSVNYMRLNHPSRAFVR